MIPQSALSELGGGNRVARELLQFIFWVHQSKDQPRNLLSTVICQIHRFVLVFLFLY